jgi:glycosyltransferase involved in cell wall biosynthesis
VGDGGEAAAIAAEAAAKGVRDFVVLPGARDDVPSLLAAMDVFALSSRMEGLPLCALEAMAAGLPVVATAVGGLPGLITDGVNGFLVPSQDEEALRRRLGALHAEPEMARVVADRGRTHVRDKHSRESMVRSYLELYAEMGAK